MQEITLKKKCNTWKWLFLASAAFYIFYFLIYELEIDQFNNIIASSLSQIRFGFSNISIIDGNIAIRKGNIQIKDGNIQVINDNGKHIITAVDTHQENQHLGHTGDLQEFPQNKYNLSKAIAIGTGITSANLAGISATNMAAKMPFFVTLIPSFCKTLTTGFSYHFYVAYDHTDEMFANDSFLEAFKKQFVNMTAHLCPSFQNTSLALHLVQCSHSKRPAWAQNDAMMEAYLDGMEYFYRINDDSVLITPDWATAFIQTLSSYTPPNVGVVGPNHHGGNTYILTYDFVHRTHVDIFGFYYPRVFTGWFADSWITAVYSPDHMKKLSSINLQHTMVIGQRYPANIGAGKFQSKEIEAGKVLIKRFNETYAMRGQQNRDRGKKVIAMSLFGQDPNYTKGAIRNAQLTPLFFPGWVLRIYTLQSKEDAQQNFTVPNRIITTLKRLGAEIVYVQTKISPYMLSYLVADDKEVDIFIIRNAQSRLCERDAITIKDWLQAAKPFHCIRDHPSHSTEAIVNGLWGANHTLLKPLFVDIPMQDFLVSAERQNQTAKTFLQDILWPLVKDHAYCHDSVSCTNWTSATKFPVARSKEFEYLGEKFDSFEQPIDNNKSRYFKVPNPACVK